MARNPTAAQRAALAAILATFEPQVRDAFLSAVYAARSRVSLQELISAYERGDLPAMLELLRMEQGSFWQLQEAIRQAGVAGGTNVAKTLPAGLKGSFSFNGQHPRAEQLLRELGAQLVQGMEQDTLEAARRVIVSALQEGRASRAVALDLTGRMATSGTLKGQRVGGMIGLTPDQADWVVNARLDLRALDRRYFTRKLRDRRYDPMVRKAIESGKPLSPAQVDKITGRYKDRLLAYRGQVVATHEVHAAQAAGRHEAYLQLSEGDNVAAVTKKWIHGHSKEPRRDHRQMDGTVIAFDQDFVMDDGARLRFPHDPRGGIKHSAGCNCTMFYRVVPKKD
ncbi:structural protein [Pseudodonghicola flavimaris]|uniref:Phage head morphogenesis domain-containing protein n=1 Tax=Pseudodonghicola flavimaris TaxID=3050036 RepID=A0ABT7EW35_9RHOB|nr:hypothetical protein [Pseudodonghicola flavimaris]MDK3016547.1 hypothetical protein [Pseudodonghicola flavimaris]